MAEWQGPLSAWDQAVLAYLTLLENEVPTLPLGGDKVRPCWISTLATSNPEVP